MAQNPNKMERRKDQLTHERAIRQQQWREKQAAKRRRRRTK